MSLISVIIPIYNVEKYLHECVDSVINQTYKDLEIILIDDESPDNCPKICDEYAKIDSRVKVIHRKNGGLSEARNSGLSVCTGEYIFCLDSDDYLEPDALEYLYNKAVETDADIAVSSLNFLYKNHSELLSEEQWEKVITAEEAFKAMMEMDTILPSAHGKLYRRKVFDGIQYPKGMLYEDTYLIGEVLQQSKKIFVTSKAKLNYRQRKGSIMHSGFNSKIMDLIKVYEHCIEIAESTFHSAVEVCRWRYLWSIFFVMDKIILSGNIDSMEFYEIQNLIKKNRRDILYSDRFSGQKKLSVYLIMLSPKLYVSLYLKRANSNDIQADDYYD